MKPLTVSERQALIEVARKRLKQYQAMKAAQDSPNVRPRGGIDFDYQVSIDLMEIALAALEAECESITAGLLEGVRDSLSLTPHQNAVISCAIDRLNSYSRWLNQKPADPLAPVMKPVKLGPKQHFDGDEWYWAEGVVKRIKEAGYPVEVEGEDNAATD